MTRYMRWLESERDLRFDGYPPLWEWSVTELEDFWSSIWDYFDVRSSRPYRSTAAATSASAAASSATSPST